jgi:hypothetical protein
MENILNLVIPQQEIKQVVDAEKQVIITLDGRRITRKEAKKLIGPIKYWQTMRRAAFHGAAVAEVVESKFFATITGKEMIFDCRKYFK